jgi:hypothetical protein
MQTPYDFPSVVRNLYHSAISVCITIIANTKRIDYYYTHVDQFI